MATKLEAPGDIEAAWRRVLIEGHRQMRVARLLFQYLPGPPRCKVCNSPFDGIGGRLVGVLGFHRSRKNPNLCNQCCESLPPGGAEVDIAVLFADVRGSTAMAEKLGASAFAERMNRFYRTATDVLVRHDAIIDKLVGDEVMALFIPGMCGQSYRQRAAEAALALLSAVSDGPEASEVPVGVAVNCGLAYVGNVGSADVTDFTALGDMVNTAARLASSAGAGELLLTESVYAAIRERHPLAETRTLALRGKEAEVAVHVARLPPS